MNGRANGNGSGSGHRANVSANDRRGHVNENGHHARGSLRAVNGNGNGSEHERPHPPKGSSGMGKLDSKG